MRIAHIIVAIMMFAVTVPVMAEQTPPIMPKIQDPDLPPPVVLPAPASIPADVPNTPLTADEAARIALSHSPSIAMAAGGVTAAQGRKQQAQSGLLPSLNVTTGYVHVDSLQTVGSPIVGSPGVSATGYTTSAAIRQLLFDFNHTRDQVRANSALVQAANAGLTKTQSDTVLQVKQAFYSYAQNLRLVAVNEGNMKNSQNHLALAQARLKAGVGLPVDVVRAETSVANAVLNVNLARNLASVSQVNLAQLMGIDPRTPVKVSDAGESAVKADDVNALVDTGLKQRPEVIQAASTIQAAKYTVGAARTGNSPSLGASVGWLGKGGNPTPENSSLTLGITLSWNPFDSGFTKGRVKEAQGSLESAEAQLNSARLNVISDISQSYLNLKTSEQRVVTAKAEVANAEEGVRLSQGRYGSGLGTFLDVLDAQSALLTAQTNLVNAQTSVEQARSSLNHAIGQPLAQ